MTADSTGGRDGAAVTVAGSVAGASAPCLGGLIVAVVGGDRREQEIARLAAEAGAEVRGFGFPWPDEGIRGVSGCESAESAMDGAGYALFPVPGLGADGSLYAPSAPSAIVPGEKLLALLRPDAAVILGRSDDQLKRAAAATGCRLVEYEDDAELMLLRGPAIVEGVIAAAVASTDVTIHASEVGVVGFGNIGALLARSLDRLGATVHVFARSRVQLAAAYAAGCRSHPLEELPRRVGPLAMLFSVVPAPVVGTAVLEQMAPGALVLDVAAPPGSVDLASAERLGLRSVWARGMGNSAPVTVGRSQWTGIARHIAEHEARKVSQ